MINARDIRKLILVIVPAIVWCQPTQATPYELPANEPYATSNHCTVQSVEPSATEFVLPANRTMGVVQPNDSVLRPRKETRGLTSLDNVFVPKGEWLLGLTGSFSTHTNNNYSVTVIKGINSEGHTIKVSPIVGYAVNDNSVVGVRFGYSRNLLRVTGGGLSIGDADSGIELSVDSYYSLKHVYEGDLLWRRYITFGNNKRFALFSEVQLSLGGSQAKVITDTPVRGTYQTSFLAGVNITPGLVAFVTNDMAFELNVGVMGITYESIRQVHNQVATGKRSWSAMSFKVNLLSVGLGISFYL